MQLKWFSIEQVFIAMLVDNFLYPISAMRSHFSQSINWSGIRYHLKNGKIFKVSWLKSSFISKKKKKKNSPIN